MGREALTTQNPADGSPGGYYPVGRQTADLYGWLVRHNLGYAQSAWGIKAVALRAIAPGRARCGRAALVAGPAATRRAGACNWISTA